MSKPVLIYFPSPGPRAEAARLSAHFGGLDFEDRRIEL